jgi:hypothetical protein
MWTYEKPIEPGWYWYWGPDEALQIGYVRHDGIVLFPVDMRRMENLQGKWQGPIEPDGYAPESE